MEGNLPSSDEPPALNGAASHSNGTSAFATNESPANGAPDGTMTPGAQTISAGKNIYSNRAVVTIDNAAR